MSEKARTTTGHVWVSTRLDALGLPGCTTGTKYEPPVRHRPPASSLGDHPASTCLTAEDGTTYYLLTPRVWGWACRAMQSAGLAAESGRASAAEYAGLQSRFERLRRWVNLTYSEAEVAEAIGNPQPLPTPAGGPGDAPSPDSNDRDEGTVPLLEPSVAEALVRFSAERAADGDVPSFEGGPVQLVEREVYLVEAPDWLAPEVGPYLTFSAEAWGRIQVYYRNVREARAREERQHGRSKEEPEVKKRKRKAP